MSPIFDNKPGEQKPAQTPSPAQPSQAQRAGNSGQNQDPTKGVKDELQVPGHPGIDARLDNRAGADRPPLEEWPAKPQQIDGPDVAHQIEHTRRTLKDREADLGERKGQFSPGPHGLSEESLRETDGPAYGPEGLSEGDVAKGAKG